MGNRAWNAVRRRVFRRIDTPLRSDDPAKGPPGTGRAWGAGRSRSLFAPALYRYIVYRRRTLYGYMVAFMYMPSSIGDGHVYMKIFCQVFISTKVLQKAHASDAQAAGHRHGPRAVRYESRVWRA